MTTLDKQNNSNPIWRFFSSVKLTIILLILLALASIIGTLIPQMPQRESIEFARSLSPGVFRFLNALDLFDMYHAIWFRFLIGCLGLNLVICSMNRFPGTWRLFRSLPRPDRSMPFEDLPPEQAFVVKRESDATADQVGQFLEKRYGKTIKKDSPHRHFFYSEKGAYSRFGVYIVHASVLLILIGALVGSFLGFEASVNISEGDKVGISDIHLKKGTLPKGLEFSIRCDKFTVDFYENKAPKEYRSELTFLVDGEEVEKASLLVNHPAQFKGVTFYQSTYGTTPGKKVRLKISRQGEKQVPDTLEVEAGTVIQLPGNEGQFSIVDVKPDFMNACPAVLIATLSTDGKEKHFWIFQDFEMIQKQLPGPMLQSPKFNPSAFEPYTFFLEGLETSYYTGLQVNRDPGVPIVWAGCFLIIAGFFITFFTSHMRMWIRVSEEKQETTISVAGTTNRNPVVLERELIRLTNDLKSLLGEKS